MEPIFTRRFESEEHAQKELRENGFSLGTLQRGDPRGVMFGEVLISKWRNLSSRDKSELHAVYQRESRDGPVKIEVMPPCPNEAIQLLQKMGK